MFRHLFRSRPIIPPDEVDWQLRCFDWLIRNTGGMGRFRHALLVLPNDEHFPQRGLRDDALAQALFKQVKAHAGMSAWRCNLQIQPADPDPLVGPAQVVQGSPRSPMGTFRRNKKRGLITYDSNSLTDPMAFVATCAHELGHFLISEIRKPAPGGDAMLEFATDLTGVFLGFGIFLVNSSFVFSQYQGGGVRGWSSANRGYLSELQLVHAFAIFTVLCNSDPKHAVPYLDRHLRRLYRATCESLKRPDTGMSALGQIPPLDGSSKDITMRWRGL